MPQSPGERPSEDDNPEMPQRLELPGEDSEAAILTILRKVKPGCLEMNGKTEVLAKEGKLEQRTLNVMWCPGLNFRTTTKKGHFV